MTAGSVAEDALPESEADDDVGTARYIVSRGQQPSGSKIALTPRTS